MRHGRLGALALLLAASLGVLAVARGQDKKDAPFDAKGWSTNTSYKPFGDPHAKRDVKDPFVIRWETFPPTLRSEGPNSNLVQTQTLQTLIYETLVQLDPETDEFVPMLANYWKIENDEKANCQTFWFHIDERAKFRDGSPVTAEDVVATFWHHTQKDRKDPMSVMTFDEGFQSPEVVDSHTIKVKTRELNWRLFLYFGAGMPIYPAKEIKIPGEKYLEDYNWKFVMGSGPYEMLAEDLKKGESLTLTRRHDWWAENEPWAKNTNNFEKIKAIVIRDEELYYQTFKKGDLDHFVVSRAQKWVQEYPKEDVVKKGWVKRRKIFNKAPRGVVGLAFNMREAPFNDKNIRLAFCYLFNREELMEKLFFNEYEFLNSYEPGRDWGNEEENELITYDPEKAAQLLAAAGYKTRDKDGFLVDKDGKRLSVMLELNSPVWERVFILAQKFYKDAGVDLQLSTIDGSTVIKKVSERNFKITWQGWGGITFPNPETSWRSSLADQKDNNNICGFKNARVDELCKKYNVVLDRAEQKKITREIDKIIYDEHPYALGWFARYHRILYWDKFGHPESYLTKTGQDPEADMINRWWWDQDRTKALADAKASDKTLEQGEVDVKPWDKK